MLHQDTPKPLQLNLKHLLILKKRTVKMFPLIIFSLSSYLFKIRCNYLFEIRHILYRGKLVSCAQINTKDKWLDTVYEHNM